MSGRISRDDTYWQKRLRAVERFSESYSRKAYSKIQSAFTLAERDIQKEINVWYARLAANNNISLSEAKRFLDRSELDEFKWDVAEYIKHSRESAVSGEWAKQLENASARVHISRLEALKIHTQHPLEKAFKAESDAVEEMARNIVEEDYYRTIFEVQRGVHIGWNIGEIDQRKLERIISKPWTTDGKTFYGRIWKRKRKMVHDLHQELTRSCIYGRPFEETVQKIEQYARSSVKNARYAAERLVRTETAYFRSISQKEALERIGVKWYKIDLTIDDRTCPICREMNGKIFPMSEFEIGVTAPPFHPNCDLGSMTPTSPENVEGEDELIDQILREIEGEEPLSEKERFEDWKKKFVYGNKVDKSKESGIIKGTTFRKFHSGDEVNDFFYFDGEEHGLKARKSSSHGKWLDGLSHDEQYATSWYTKDGYGDINNYWRKRSGWESIPADVVEDSSRQIDAAISKFTLKENIWVQRGVEDFFGGSLVEDREWNDIHEIIGMTYHDLGYTSTTALMGNSVATAKPYLLEIEVPSGTGRGAYVNKLAGINEDREYEFLIARGSKFEITNVVINEEPIPPQTIIRMRMIVDE